MYGDPQEDLYVVHVAGTDGKGSTVNYLCDLLMSQGLKVGTFTSPHLITHLDRIRVNGENIRASAFLNILNENYDFYTQNDLSMFEMDYLIMCEYFKSENVDVAIIEVGLGGRLDSTNVINDTKLSIITSIGYDHMERLGNTLPEICMEKCGIIKNGSKVLVGHLNEECLEVVKTTVEERNCSLYVLDDYEDLGNRSFRFHGKEYQISSYASYQLHNASLALYAFEITAEDLDLTVDEGALKKALKGSLWQCRFQIVREKPRVILDGAHNIHGVEALVRSFDQFEGSKCIVFSALKRKEYRKMADLLKTHCDQLIVTDFPKSDVIDLAEFKDYETDRDYRHAIDTAIKNYDNVLICGSLYFMSEVVLNYDFK
jgi:dihydrofolate synthase/folylpolyglutamate synthase